MSDLVVKDNTLINASYNLNLVEQRLILLAIVAGREKKSCITKTTDIRITAQKYAEIFEVDLKNVYAELKSNVKTLFERKIKINKKDELTGKDEKKYIRWLSSISYIDKAGAIKLCFSSDILPLIIRLEQNFSSYQLKEIKNLGVYSIRLYEILIAWKSVGTTPKMKVSDFKESIGVLNGEYGLMQNFKARVLNPAIKQINEHTDLNIKLIDHKKGRTIESFSFKINTNKNIHQNETTKHLKMTDPQRKLFSKKLAKLPEISHLSARGESFDDFSLQLEDRLSDSDFIMSMLPYLKNIGYSPNK